MPGNELFCQSPQWFLFQFTADKYLLFTKAINITYTTLCR